MSVISPVVLVGFMGTGKSAVGRCLAQHLRVPFIDSDTEIEKMAGKPIASVFNDSGESAFRTWETLLLDTLLTHHLQKERQAEQDKKGFVLATGGGMPLQPGNAALLRQLGCIVWLTASVDDILLRVGADLALRPLLTAYADDPRSRITQLLETRSAGYAAVSDLSWDTSAYLTPDNAAKALAEHLCQLT